MAISSDPELRAELRVNESLARYTSWRVGGPADYFYRPADLSDLSNFLGYFSTRLAAPAPPIFWLGLGSNLLIRDGGIAACVVATHNALKELSVIGSNKVRAEAGVACAKVARFAAQHDLGGAEFLAGIPGTMGGALTMNAGAWGGETWDWVSAVELIDRWGKISVHRAAEFEVAYRSVTRRAEDAAPAWFVAAHLQLPNANGADSLTMIRRLLEQRGSSQPTGVASCGSVFRNPPGDYAARLIESAGLKGLRVGNACVSEKHANFIINQGGASAADLEALIERVAQAVARVHGVELIREVRIVGRALPGHEVSER